MLLCFSRIIGYVGPWSTVAGLWQMRNPPATRKLFIHYFVGNVLQKVQRHSWIYFTFAISVTCVPCEEILEIILNPSSCLHFSKGRMATPKWMNFRKISKRPLTPPPHFWKVIAHFFYQFHAHKALSRICNKNLWIENDPRPPLQLFRKCLRFGVAIRPHGLILNSINKRIPKYKHDHICQCGWQSGFVTKKARRWPRHIHPWHIASHYRFSPAFAFCTITWVEWGL